MPWPWKRRKPKCGAPDVPTDWIERHLWLGWEPPRNYVAGEQTYPEALHRLAGPTCEQGYCFGVPSRFVREPNNPYDQNAFRAELDGRQIGYLRRHVAAYIAPQLDVAGCRSFEVPAVVRAGRHGRRISAATYGSTVASLPDHRSRCRKTQSGKSNGRRATVSFQHLPSHGCRPERLRFTRSRPEAVALGLYGREASTRSAQSWKRLPTLPTVARTHERPVGEAREDDAADVTRVAAEGRTWLATFRLRDGRTPCTGTAEVRFAVRDGKLTEWRQLPPPPPPSGLRTSAPSGQG